MNRLFTSYPGSGRSSFFPYHLHFLFPILSKLPIKFKINSLSYQCFVAVIICLGGPPYVNHNCFPSLKCLFFLELIFASFFFYFLNFLCLLFLFSQMSQQISQVLISNASKDHTQFPTIHQRFLFLLISLGQSSTLQLCYGLI